MPVLAVNRHHVCMPREHDAWRSAIAQSGEQIGLAPIRIPGQARRHPQPRQFIANPFDEPEVGIAADGIEPDQRVQNLEGSRAGATGTRRCRVAEIRTGNSLDQRHGVQEWKASIDRAYRSQRSMRHQSRLSSLDRRYSIAASSPTSSR